ncbi:MAG: WD40 repeat domain-containing protein [Leptolyngbya sp.]|nr:WD40 repeat domain-containing protein [Candidatus Melainabacteria bacterium]
MPQKESSVEHTLAPLPEIWKKITALDYISDVSWSPDGNQIACADASGYVSIIAAKTGYMSLNWHAHKVGTLMARWSHDGKYFASAGQDGKVRIYDGASFEKLSTIDHGGNWVEHIAWHGQRDVILSAAGKQLKLSNADGSLVQNFTDHKSTIADVAWHPVVPDLFATSSYGGARLWTISKHQHKRFLDWKGSLLNISYSPNGKVLAAGCQDGAAHIWLLPSGEDLFMNGYPTKVRELSWDSSSRYLATGGGAEIIVWDFAGKGPSGSKPLVFSGHESFVSVLKFAPQGLRLASGGIDGNVLVWDINKKGKTWLSSDTSEVSGLSWRAEGKLLVASYASGGLALFEIP